MIKLKNTPDQLELVKAMGSKDQEVSRQAINAYVSAVGPVLQEVLLQLGTSSQIFSDFPFQEGSNQTIPLSVFRGEGENYITVWTNTSMPGGLPSSEVSSAEDLKFSTTKFESAVNFPKKYATYQNVNVVSAATERMLNEVVVKRDLTAWATLMRALGEARTNINGVSTDHILQAATINVFKLADLSQFITLSRRINHSYAEGTAVNPYSKGITDLFVSPEIKEQIRAFVYNPMNTTAVPNTDESTAVPLPDAMREEIYRNAGATSLWDINITDLNELGDGFKYNVLFGLYAPAGVAVGGGNFSAANDQVLVGIDMSRRESSLFSPVANDSYDGTSFTVQNDDQWVSRSERIGFWGRESRGFVVADARVLQALVV